MKDTATNKQFLFLNDGRVIKTSNGSIEDFFRAHNHLADTKQLHLLAKYKSLRPRPRLCRSAKILTLSDYWDYIRLNWLMKAYRAWRRACRLVKNQHIYYDYLEVD